MKVNIHQRMYSLRKNIMDLENRINESRDNFLREELASSLRSEKKKLINLEKLYSEKY